MLMFGPDGCLYASLGDGANATDQGQDRDTPFATIIRLDVDSGDDPYGIPADNPQTPRINAFGVDSDGELYLVVHDGFLARIVAER
jgi:glucose/arabinose dehydrogenase